MMAGTAGAGAEGHSGGSTGTAVPGTTVRVDNCQGKAPVQVSAPPARRTAAAGAGGGQWRTPLRDTGEQATPSALGWWEAFEGQA